MMEVKAVLKVMEVMDMKVIEVEVMRVEAMKVMDMMEVEMMVVEVMEMRVAVAMSTGVGPHAPGCPGLCSDTASSAPVRRPSQSGSKVKEGKIRRRISDV